MTYTIIRIGDELFAKFPDGELIGPYRLASELYHDMESIQQHLAAGSFGGAK